MARTGTIDTLELRIGPRGKPIARSEAVGGQLAAGAPVDDLAEERTLDLDLVLLEVDVPAAPRAAPAVAAGFQQILRLDRRALRPEAHRGPSGGFQQAGQGQAPRRPERAVEQPEQGMAVINSPVALVEEPVVDQQVAELHALVALGPPRDLVAGAGPVLLGKHRPPALAHLPVKAGVVGDDHRGFGRERLHGGIVDALTGHIGVGDPGQARDLRRDRFLGLVQLVERLEHPVDAPAGTVLELENAELDHLVRSEVGAGGFDVKHEIDKGRLVGRLRTIGQRRQPAQHAVVPRAFEHARDAVEGLVHGDTVPAWSSLAGGASAVRLCQ